MGYLNDIKDSAYYICRDGTQEIRPMDRGLLNSDGHCTVAPKGLGYLLIPIQIKSINEL